MSSDICPVCRGRSRGRGYCFGCQGTGRVKANRSNDGTNRFKHNKHKPRSLHNHHNTRSDAQIIRNLGGDQKSNDDPDLLAMLLSSKLNLNNHTNPTSNHTHHSNKNHQSNHQNRHNQQRLCKFNCGRTVAAGIWRNGKPYSTCCRDCGVSHGTMNLHGSGCDHRHNSHRSHNQHRHNHHHNHQQNEEKVQDQIKDHEWMPGDKLENLTCLYYGGPLNRSTCKNRVIAYNQQINFHRNIRYGTVIKFPGVPRNWRNLPWK